MEIIGSKPEPALVARQSISLSPFVTPDDSSTTVPASHTCKTVTAARLSGFVRSWQGNVRPWRSTMICSRSRTSTTTRFRITSCRSITSSRGSRMWVKQTGISTTTRDRTCAIRSPAARRRIGARAPTGEPGRFHQEASSRSRAGSEPHQDFWAYDGARGPVFVEF